MQTRTLIALLVGICALFIGFSWWVYLSSGSALPLALPVTGTLLPFAIASGLWLWQRRVGQRAASKLESAIVADGATQARGSAELERLRSEFDRAVKALKTSKLGAGSRSTGDALYRLPWYAIIGPPASGKTTVLRNSGLKFPYLPGTGDRLKGVGGTRNCDWWLTNHAILLDTAGRWSIEEDERDEWLTFLDLLKKHRGQRPLNGIIAAISVSGDAATSISGAEPEELREIALRMRERLDEITGRLGVALPVYLLFTKCDLISGFVESFGDLSSDRRRQIWGFTAPVLQGARRDPGHYFGQQFDILRDELERRALERMGAEVDTRKIAAIYEFPAQFAALKDKLTYFVEELFDASAYRETPLLRGAYFTSGTQEGAPADLLYEDMAEALDLRPAQTESRDEKKGYFLHDMLMRVVFEDRALATTSENELTRLQWRRRALTTALFASAALVGMFSTDSCQRNARAIDGTQTALTHSRNTASQLEAASASADGPVHVRDLLALERDFTGYEQRERRVSDLGLYQGDRIAPALGRYYHNGLAEWLVRPLLHLNQAALLTRTQQLQVSAGAKQPGEQDDTARAELRDALGLHILLTNPREACTPKPLARKAFILDRLLALWGRADELGHDVSAVPLPERKQLLTRYLELSNQEPTTVVLARDQRAVDQARRALGEDDQVTRLLTRIVARFAEQPRGLAQLGGTSVVFETPARVSAAFSRTAWARISRDIAANDFRDPDGDWVFGCGRAETDAATADKDIQTFRTSYLQRYEADWRAFLNSLSVRTPRTVLDAESMLSELVNRRSVLGTLLQNVRDETELPAAPSGAADALGAVAALADKVQNTSGDAASPKQALAQLGKSKLTEALGAARARANDDPEAVARAQLRAAFADLASFDAVAGASDVAANGGERGARGGETPLEQYRRQLEPVLVAIKAYRDDENKLDELSVAAQTALENTERLLRGQGGTWDARLRELLTPVLRAVVELAQHGRAAQLSRAYCDAVYAPFRQELAGRFPLDPDSAEPASLDAFTRFFQPGTGTLATFQTMHLAGYVAAEGGKFRFTGNQARSVLRPELLTFLQRAAAVSEAFFPRGETTLHMPFRVRVRGAPGYSKTTFRSGARSVQYDSGLESWTALEWPGEQPSLGATLSVTAYQGSGPRPITLDNPWGLFMILQPRAGAQPLDQTRKLLTIGWKPKGDQHFVKVDFAADDPRSPILAAPFGGARGKLFPLSAPARSTAAGALCGAGSQ
ncbi:MAG: hypothetical protein RL701_4831 [Pseudomonadota bacterium]